MNPAAVGFVALVLLLLCTLLGSLAAQGWWFVRGIDNLREKVLRRYTLAYGAVLVAAAILMVAMWEAKP